MKNIPIKIKTEYTREGIFQGVIERMNKAIFGNIKILEIIEEEEEVL